MKYSLLLSHKFNRAFSKLDRILQDRVVVGLRELGEDPYAGKRLKGKLKDLWSWRVVNIEYYIKYRKKKY